MLLFKGLIALFNTIHGSHYTISTNIYLYLQYFQQKVFNFNKISGFQIDPDKSNPIVSEKINTNNPTWWKNVHSLVPTATLY